jgi:hypothetical protein
MQTLPALNLANIKIPKELMAEIKNSHVPTSSAEFRRISTAGRTFSPSDEKFPPTSAPLEVIVVDYAYRYDYYGGLPYNPKELTAPVCSAVGDIPANMRMHENSTKPQTEEDGLCDECPQGQWGSSPTGAGKACKNSIRLGVLPADFKAGDVPYTVDLAPTAIKPFHDFVNLLHTNGVHLMMIVCEMYFDPKSTYASVRLRMRDEPVHERLDDLMRIREATKELVMQAPYKDPEI